MSHGIPVTDLYACRVALARPGHQPPSQVVIAQRAGISTRMYGRIETGRSDPSPDTLRRLAKALKVTQARLCGEG